MWVSDTGLFLRWHFVVLVGGDGSIMEVNRCGRDSVCHSMITVTFSSDLSDPRPHVSGAGSWIDVSKSCAILLGNVGSNTFYYYYY